MKLRGTWNEERGRYNVSVPTIFDKMIVEASKCKSHQSDVLWDIGTISDLLSVKSTETSKIILGFRESGVDSGYILRYKLEDKYTYGVDENYYRACAVIAILKTDDEVVIEYCEFHDNVLEKLEEKTKEMEEL